MARVSKDHDAIVKRDAQITRTALEDYVTYLRRPHRVFWTNVLAGVGRGVGVVIGATLVITLLLLVLAQLSQLPHVGYFFQWMGEQIGQGVEKATN